MTEAVLVAFVCLVVAAWILLPLRTGPRRQERPEGDRKSEAEAATRSALAGIVDIEEEQAVGKLSDADFDSLRRQYEAEALAALRELDAIGDEPAGADGDPPPAPDAAAGDDIEAEIAALRARLACPTCGAIRSAEGVCDRCGAS